MEQTTSLSFLTPYFRSILYQGTIATSSSLVHVCNPSSTTVQFPEIRLANQLLVSSIYCCQFILVARFSREAPRMTVKILVAGLPLPSWEDLPIVLWLRLTGRPLTVPFGFAKIQNSSIKEPLGHILSCAHLLTN
jgi:hypothetical protein